MYTPLCASMCASMCVSVCVQECGEIKDLRITFSIVFGVHVWKHVHVCANSEH